MSLSRATAAVACGSDEDPEVGGEAGLTNEFRQPARAQGLLERAFLGPRFGHQHVISHGLTLPYRRRPPKPVSRRRVSISSPPLIDHRVLTGGSPLVPCKGQRVSFWSARRSSSPRSSPGASGHTALTACSALRCE